MECKETKEKNQIVKVALQNLIDQQATNKFLVYVQHK
jgi:hypothetical protein